MQFNNVSMSNRYSSLLSTHTVLRNTYLLLSLTLIFSTITASYSVITQAGFGSSLISIFVAFGLLFIINMTRNSGWGIVAVFAFTGCMGYSMGPLLNHFIRGYSNGGQLIATALGGTGVTFLFSSIYVLVTKKELSHWRKFLMIGVVICMIASIANIFFKLPAMQLTISTIVTFIATMLMMYDTSRIIHGGETNYIMATVSLFIDILMLFQNLLTLLGVFEGKE